MQVNCSVCGKEYEQQRRVHDKQNYCSYACRQRAYRLRRDRQDWTPDDSLADFENELLAAISARTKDHTGLVRLVADLKLWYDDIDRQDIIICLYRLHLATVNESPDPQLVARIPRKDMT